MKTVAWMVVAAPHYATPFANEEWSHQVAKLHGGAARALVYLDDALDAIRAAETAAALGGFEAGRLSLELGGDCF